MINKGSPQSVAWTRYTFEEDRKCPDYKVPWDAKSIEDEMNTILPFDKLFIAYLPLDFYTMPLWPSNRDQWTGPFDGIFYFCVQCHNPCDCGAQLCMEFFMPSEMEEHEHNKYPWSWLPRLRCRNCILDSDNTELRNLAYFPHAIYMEEVIGAEINKALTTFASTRKKATSKYKSICKVCDKPIKKKNHKWCSPLCHQYYLFIQKLNNPPLQGGTTGLFQLMELFDMFKRFDTDINAALCFTDICARYKVSIKPCRREGNQYIKCKKCHRVAFCSKRCRNINEHSTGHKCTVSWDKVFDTPIIILQE